MSTGWNSRTVGRSDRNSRNNNNNNAFRPARLERQHSNTRSDGSYRPHRSERHPRAQHRANRSAGPRLLAAPRSGEPTTGPPELRGKYFGFDMDGQEAMFIIARKAVAEYAVTKYDMGREIYKLVMTGVDTTFDDPAPLTENQAKKQHLARQWESKMKRAEDNRKQLNMDKAQFIMVVKKQCYSDMLRELEGMDEPKELDDIIDDNDIQGLFDALKAFAFNLHSESKVYIYWTQQAMWRRLLAMIMLPGEPLEAFAELWEAQSEAVEEMWGGLTPFIMIETGATEAEQEIAAKKFKACLFLAAVDQTRYEEAINELHNDFNKTTDNFPVTVKKMVSHLKRHRSTTSRNTRHMDGTTQVHAQYEEYTHNQQADDEATAEYDDEYEHDEGDFQTEDPEHLRSVGIFTQTRSSNRSSRRNSNRGSHPNTVSEFNARRDAFNASSGH